PGPGIGRELTVPQQLACALRILAYEGWRENLDGHISWSTPDGGMWMNPWGVWWDEVRASQIIRLDAHGNVVEGDWDVTGAVSIHTELHRARADAAVVVHNHPYYATLLAAMGELLKKLLNDVTGSAYWGGAVRMLIAREPDVLE